MVAHHFKNAVRISPEHQAARYWLWLTLAEREGAGEREIELARGLVEAGNETPIRYYRGAAARHFRAGQTAAALVALSTVFAIGCTEEVSDGHDFADVQEYVDGAQARAARDTLPSWSFNSASK